MSFLTLPFALFNKCDSIIRIVYLVRNYINFQESKSVDIPNTYLVRQIRSDSYFFSVYPTLTLINQQYVVTIESQKVGESIYLNNFIASVLTKSQHINLSALRNSHMQEVAYISAFLLAPKYVGAIATFRISSFFVRNFNVSVFNRTQSTSYSFKVNLSYSLNRLAIRCDRSSTNLPINLKAANIKSSLIYSSKPYAPG